jgi:hypothetical protein
MPLFARYFFLGAHLLGRHGSRIGEPEERPLHPNRVEGCATLRRKRPLHPESGMEAWGREGRKKPHPLQKGKTQRDAAPIDFWLCPYMRCGVVVPARYGREKKGAPPAGVAGLFLTHNPIVANRRVSRLRAPRRRRERRRIERGGQSLGAR